ncbi:hypothetical protein [Microbacterium sp. P03]|uniref:hypothetical protein n=1 Tax=Microbacterium sp. P03 TaxID=3366946 RepID=UPI00374512AB
MTTPEPPRDVPTRGAAGPQLQRAAIWVAIGALIAAALLCVVWVLVGSTGDIIGRAFSTILLLAAFAGAAILDVHLAPRRPGWLALASMVGWVAILVIGAVMIWLPDTRSGVGFVRFVEFLLIVLIVQLALLHVTLFAKAVRRNPTTFVRVIAGITVALVGLLALMLVLSLMLNEFIDFRGWYWRLVVAITILAAVGTALIPLMNLLFAPRKARPAGPGTVGGPYPSAAASARPAPFPPQAPPVFAGSSSSLEPQAHVQPLPWPMFADGRTPLPVMPDGSPDWGAFYTGRMSPGARPPGAPAAPPAPPTPHGQGYPPAPPLPPTR